jgi:hypothetical protein
MSLGTNLDSLRLRRLMSQRSQSVICFFTRRKDPLEESVISNCRAVQVECCNRLLRTYEVRSRNHSRSHNTLCAWCSKKVPFWLWWYSHTMFVGSGLGLHRERSDQKYGPSSQARHRISLCVECGLLTHANSNQASIKANYSFIKTNSLAEPYSKGSSNSTFDIRNLLCEIIRPQQRLP